MIGILIIWIVPMIIIKYENRYLIKHGKKNIFEKDFSWCLFWTLTPITNWGAVAILSADILDCISINKELCNKFKNFIHKLFS